MILDMDQYTLYQKNLKNRDSNKPIDSPGNFDMEQLLGEQREQLNHFFSFIDVQNMHSFFQDCLACPGFLVFTGVGKSGLIAEKIAATLISTGTRSLYLPATDSLHGDLGILSDKDYLILLSKSGETDELLELVPFARKKGAKLLAVISQSSSRLAKLCDRSLYLPVLRELCPFDLAPTTSAAIQLLFGDLLAVYLMRSKEFSLTSYASNHPAGVIGKKIILLVDDLMLQGDQIPLCSPDDRLMDVLVELSDKRCGSLLIADSQGRLEGIFTDGDLRRALQSQGVGVLELSMRQLMTRSPITMTSGTLAIEPLQKMQADAKRWVQVAPVIKGEKIVGIIRMHDIVQSGLRSPDPV